jgi:hypothetical protein
VECTVQYSEDDILRVRKDHQPVLTTGLEMGVGIDDWPPILLTMSGMMGEELVLEVERQTVNNNVAVR